MALAPSTMLPAKVVDLLVSVGRQGRDIAPPMSVRVGCRAPAVELTVLVGPVEVEGAPPRRKPRRPLNPAIQPARRAPGADGGGGRPCRCSSPTTSPSRSAVLVTWPCRRGSRSPMPDSVRRESRCCAATLRWRPPLMLPPPVPACEFRGWLLPDVEPGGGAVHRGRGGVGAERPAPVSARVPARDRGGARIGVVAGQRQRPAPRPWFGRSRSRR